MCQTLFRLQSGERKKFVLVNFLSGGDRQQNKPLLGSSFVAAKRNGAERAGGASSRAGGRPPGGARSRDPRGGPAGKSRGGGRGGGGARRDGSPPGVGASAGRRLGRVTRPRVRWVEGGRLTSDSSTRPADVSAPAMCQRRQVGTRLWTQRTTSGPQEPDGRIGAYRNRLRPA